MNVTKDGIKDRQLNTGYLQKVSAEQKEYAEASAHQRITERNCIITDLQCKYVKTKEPPSTEPYAGWCGRSVGEIITYLLPDMGSAVV